MQIRRRGRRGRMLATVAGALLVAALATSDRASASVYTSGCTVSDTCTVAELLAGATITAGGQRFASFEVNTDPGTIDWSKVVVIGRDDAGLAPGPGLAFLPKGEAVVLDGEKLDWTISFRVEPVIPNLQPTGTKLSLLGYAANGSGLVEVDDTIFDLGLSALGDEAVRSDDAFGDTRLDDTFAYAPQAGGLLMTHDVVVQGEQAGDLAELGEYVQRFALVPVPEPTWAPTLASGLGLLAVLGHRRARRVTTTIVGGAHGSMYEGEI